MVSTTLLIKFQEKVRNYDIDQIINQVLMKKKRKELCYQPHYWSSVRKQNKKKHAGDNAIDQVLRRKKLYQPHYCPGKKNYF